MHPCQRVESVLTDPTLVSHGYGRTALEPFRYVSGASCEKPGSCSTGKMTAKGNSKFYEVGPGKCLGVRGALQPDGSGRYRDTTRQEVSGKRGHYTSELGYYSSMDAPPVIPTMSVSARKGSTSKCRRAETSCTFAASCGLRGQPHGWCSVHGRRLWHGWGGLWGGRWWLRRRRRLLRSKCNDSVYNNRRGLQMNGDCNARPIRSRAYMSFSLCRHVEAGMVRCQQQSVSHGPLDSLTACCRCLRAGR